MNERNEGPVTPSVPLNASRVFVFSGYFNLPTFECTGLLKLSVFGRICGCIRAWIWCSLVYHCG